MKSRKRFFICLLGIILTFVMHVYGVCGEEGMLTKPDHPDAVSHDKLIFIGDSRTEGMRDAVQDGNIWSCKSAMGYTWMADTGVPQIED